MPRTKDPENERKQREKIVEAAVSTITARGLQNLSLSEIEKRAGMARGQLTYYFPTKEEILLAVFDRLVVLMHQRIGQPPGANGAEATAWGWVQHLFEKLLTQPPVSPEFGCLQYTFLSQIGHRKVFRRRLATLYEAWRSNMSLGFANDLIQRRTARPFSPRAMATLVQAILHGLGMQRAADPNAFDGGEMLELCLDVLSIYLWNDSRTSITKKPVKNKKPSLRLPAKARRSLNGTGTKGVNGERNHG
ncbi:MAG TPA: TetR/AcrR family transcriptional regulator [Gemmataceae bacterium]|nr:TetR/AcrR family transcriptional regulator [Gemmataceae bacterium]